MAGTLALTIKQYDTLPTMVATLTDANGSINLTNASGVLMGLKGNTMGNVLIATCSIISAVNGAVAYGWGANDLQTPDTYQAEFKIIWQNGAIQKVPNTTAANPQIEVDQSIATSAV